MVVYSIIHSATSHFTLHSISGHLSTVNGNEKAPFIHDSTLRSSKQTRCDRAELNVVASSTLSCYKEETNLKSDILQKKTARNLFSEMVLRKYWR